MHLCSLDTLAVIMPCESTFDLCGWTGSQWMQTYHNSKIICHGFGQYPIVVASYGVTLYSFIFSNSHSLKQPTPPLHTHSFCLCYNYVPPLENQLSHISIIRHHSSPINQSATDNITPPAFSHSNFLGAGISPVSAKWLPGWSQEC